MIAIKRLLAAIASIAFLLALSVSAFAVNFRIDGKPDADEWDGAQAIELLKRSEDSNSAVQIAMFKAYIDNEEGAVYFLFLSECSDLALDNTLCGVSLNVNSSGDVPVHPGSDATQFNSNAYSYFAAAKVGKNNCFYCEMRVGFKYGVPKEIPVAIRFFDAKGEASTVFWRVLVNGEYSEPEPSAVILPQTQPTEKVVTTKAPKTTAVRTTQEKTTREKHTAASTAPHTKKSVTVKSTTASQIVINIVMPTTKAQETIKAAVTGKTTAAQAAGSLTSVCAPETSTQYVLHGEDTVKLRRKRLLIGGATLTALGGISAFAMLTGGKKRGATIAKEITEDKR